MGKKDQKLTLKERLENCKNQIRECETLYQRLQGAVTVLKELIKDEKAN